MILSGQFQTFATAGEYVRYHKVSPFPRAMHSQYECFYIRKGHVTITIDGKTRTMGPGDLSCAAPFVFHQVDMDADAEADVLIFSPYLCPKATELFGSRKPKDPFLSSQNVPPLVKELLEVLPQATGELPKRNRFTAQFCYILDPDRCDQISLYLSVLLAELIRVMELEALEDTNLNMMQTVLAYCSSNFTQDISRESVAQACRVSIGSVSQVFARMNTSFREYINDLRITKAHYLLMTTKKPVTEIIYECGYSNQGTFNRNFFAKFGQTPRQIRNFNEGDSHPL